MLLFLAGALVAFGSVGISQMDSDAGAGVAFAGALAGCNKILRNKVYFLLFNFILKSEASFMAVYKL